MRVPEPLGEDPMIHACALAYLSDEDLLGVALLPHPSGGDWDSMMAASLDHAIWFHRPVRADEWLLFSIEGHGVANARGLGIAQVFDRDGHHVATVAQEGLGRVRR
jgi:acyl-CoA thioesterase-2